MAGHWDPERLTQVIQQWNVDHYDLFELSAPNQELEFHGVVRFYFQGGNGASVITKCIRVASTATTRDVIDTLIEKFRPDMRMLTQNKYALYEVHVNGEERRLGEGEKVLWVQLNWGKDVREGRFLLKNEDEKTMRCSPKDPALGFTHECHSQCSPKDPALGFSSETGAMEIIEDPALGFSNESGATEGSSNSNFKRKLSKRAKKEQKRREEELARQSNQSVSSKLYDEAPETSFTRSISNPEAVMRRRRQQKLEKKLAQMQSNREGGANESGGTLKIYGESLRPDVPYKTLLLSTADTTVTVIKEAMEKYGLDQQDPAQFCLVEVLLPAGSQEYHGGSVGDERVLDDGECPLAISMQHPKHRGNIIFQLRHRAADYKRRNKRQRAVSHEDLRKAHDQPGTQADKLPYLVELNPRDGQSQKHLLPLNITEVVRDQPVTPGNQFLKLTAPDIRPQHCIMAHTEGVVTVTPTARDAEIYVEKRRVTDTTMLRHGMTIQFGRHHFFKFVDPRMEELSTQQGSPTHVGALLPQETNFDVDGHVETVSVQRPGTQQRAPDGRVTPGLQPPGKGPQADQLPASLDFRPEAEDRLLRAVIQEVNCRSVQFKLAPTYVLYMSVRRLLFPSQQTNVPRGQHGQMVSDFIARMAKIIQRTIQEQHNDPTSLAFWMANSSEILNQVKQDVDIRPFTSGSSAGSDGQELLAEAVQMSFHHLVRCFQGDLQRVLPAFLDPTETFDDGPPPQDPGRQYQGQPTLADVLNTLSAAMTLLRRCRVNAALTIQLFSQLFHFINTWLFNLLALEPQLRLCSRAWGQRLKRRLGRLEGWAEKQGLELAADCHLCRIIQAAHLLQAPKVSSEDLNGITSTCFKLNSLQIRALLTRYLPDPAINEPPLNHAFVDRLAAITEDITDELIRTEGGEVRLEEDPDLHLPFLLPEDGYSCDTVRGIPDGLPEFVTPLTSAGLCHMTANNMASGSWTVHMGGQSSSLSSSPMNQPPSPQSGLHPDVMVVSFKKLMGSMGLSIVAAVGEGLAERGIYIKSVVPGGAAAQDGRLKAGDQLLEVDGRNLVGLSQDKAAEVMTQTGQVVTLKVAKEGAVFHGLATLLNEPSPTLQRHATKVPPGSMEEAPPPYSDQQQISPSDSGHARPVPQPRAHNQPPTGGLERGRSPSVDNLTSDPQQQQHSHYRVQQPPRSNFHRREVDPRSKSTSNLSANVSFEEDDSSGMRVATSVGGLHHPEMPSGRYSPYRHHPGLPRQSSDATQYSTNYNYENQSQVSSGSGGHHSGLVEGFRPGAGGVGPNQQPRSRPSDRSSLSSRSSSNSGRDPPRPHGEPPRPQSAYFNNNNNSGSGGSNAHPAHSPEEDRGSFSGSRPKSVEVTTNKVREWQEKYTTHNINVPQGQRSPHYHGQQGRGSGGPPPPSHNPGYNRMERNPSYGGAAENVNVPPHMSKNPVMVLKPGANVHSVPGPASSAAPHQSRPGPPQQASRTGGGSGGGGGGGGNAAAGQKSNYANFRSVVSQGRPQQEAPRVSARDRLFPKSGAGGAPTAGGGGGMSKPALKSEQQPQQQKRSPEGGQPPSQQFPDMPIKPDSKPKPAVKPKPRPPVARKPQGGEGGKGGALERQMSTGSQGVHSPQTQHPPSGFPPHPRGLQQQGYPPQGSYGHPAIDDFPPPPEEEFPPPPPPEEDFYHPPHEQDGVMDPIPPPLNLHPHPDDPNYQNMNFGPGRDGGQPPRSSSSSQYNAPAASSSRHQQAALECRAREQEMAELQGRSYLSLQEQEKLRQLQQEQDFQRRMMDMESRSDYDADDSEVESYGHPPQHPQHPGQRNNQQGLPRTSPNNAAAYPLPPPQAHQQGPPYHPHPHHQHQPPDPVSAERQRLEALSLGSRPHYPAHDMAGAPGGHVTNHGGRNNPLGSSFDHPPPTADPSYEYMNFPPPQQHQHPHQGSAQRPDSLMSSDPRAQDQGYHSMPHPHHMPTYAEEQQEEEGYPSFQQASKKSVSFNTDLNTYQVRTPSHSYSSDHMSPPADMSPSGNSEVFHMPPSSSPHHFPYHPPHHGSSYGTPNVIGSQEVYRDPRSRIEAQKAAEQSRSVNDMSDSLSFKDKMKLFRKEGGGEGGGAPQYNSQPPGRPPWNSDYPSNGR